MKNCNNKNTKNKRSNQKKIKPLDDYNAGCDDDGDDYDSYAYKKNGGNEQTTIQDETCGSTRYKMFNNKENEFNSDNNDCNKRGKSAPKKGIKSNQFNKKRNGSNKRRNCPIEESEDEEEEYEEDEEDEEEEEEEDEEEDEYDDVEDFQRKLIEKNRKNQIKIIKTNERSKVINNDNYNRQRRDSNNKNEAERTTRRKSTDKSKKINDILGKKGVTVIKQRISKTIINIPKRKLEILEPNKKNKDKTKIKDGLKVGDIIKKGYVPPKILSKESSKKYEKLISSLFEIKQNKEKEKTLETKKNKRRRVNNSMMSNTVPETQETEAKEDLTYLYDKLNKLEYTEYPYQIKEEDYFTVDGQKVYTILNSEDAAIKKCELIFNSIPNGKMYIDEDFGSKDNDNNKQSSYCLYGKKGIPAGNIHPMHVGWYTMPEIISEPKFFKNGTESNDVIQGALGDCWFISALSVMATKDYLLKGEFSESILSDGVIDDEEALKLSVGVYPPIFQGFRKKGIFCFRFFKNSKWRYVIVDSRIPCEKKMQNTTTTILYGKCRDNEEFWVPLIEKAYAKLHGSYAALISGFIDDGLVDLTGLTSKKIIIEDSVKTNKKEKDLLWEKLVEYSKLEFDDDNNKNITSKYIKRNKVYYLLLCY